MSFELVSIPTGEPAAIPASTGRHRGPGRSTNWRHRARHRHGPVTVAELLPQPMRDYVQWSGVISVPRHFGGADSQLVAEVSEPGGQWFPVLGGGAVRR